MFTLRLFRHDDPFSQIDAREIAAGQIVVGRDEDADWTIEDPNRTISRRHCVVTLDADGLNVRDTSANGVFLGRSATRVPADESVPVTDGDTFRLGEFMMLVEARATAAQTLQPTSDASLFEAPFVRPILEDGALNQAAATVPSDWSEASKPTPSDGSLLDAFCAGAKLDASLFAGQDPLEVMRHLGAVYQQTMLGLSDLMNERTAVKADYSLDHTRVHAQGNNPFRWAPAQRVAVDLLRDRDDGFLSGRAAVAASFEDLKKHLLCLMAGMRGAIGATLDELSPQAIEAPSQGQAFTLKPRSQVAWAQYLKLHADLQTRALADPHSALNRAFVTAYEQRAQELDAMGVAA
ncbi:MAG: type VI secretion system-associated FHA domain protein TagH [Phenylobacterium sp.]|uniref:type VI secretion system-associated FHA domain protein TagH n=1 Tax=Phenylobacterium sp. TaxID=1871053 RepID=UPI0027373A40|nr:type VI secretion system-associated FHA domain protein TagH [Phenylobacterium sp.]MDP3175888.1 type VI secretion system-associated FHA domain protein TagH [Phenylobacterium sp.]